jgi:hypothetical protein
LKNQTRSSPARPKMPTPAGTLRHGIDSASQIVSWRTTNPATSISIVVVTTRLGFRKSNSKAKALRYLSSLSLSQALSLAHSRLSQDLLLLLFLQHVHHRCTFVILLQESSDDRCRCRRGRRAVLVEHQRGPGATTHRASADHSHCPHFVSHPHQRPGR